MSFEITLKDILYIGGYIVTFASLYMSVKYEINQLKEKFNGMKIVLFNEKGQVDLVDKDDCDKRHSKQDEEIRGSRTEYSEVKEQLSVITNHITLIMYHLDIDASKQVKSVRRLGTP